MIIIMKMKMFLIKLTAKIVHILIIGQPVLFFKNKVTSMSVSMSYSSPLVAVEVYEKQEGGSIGIDIEKYLKISQVNF